MEKQANREQALREREKTLRIDKQELRQLQLQLLKQLTEVEKYIRDAESREKKPKQRWLDDMEDIKSKINKNDRDIENVETDIKQLEYNAKNIKLLLLEEEALKVEVKEADKEVKEAKIRLTAYKRELSFEELLQNTWSSFVLELQGALSTICEDFGYAPEESARYSLCKCSSGTRSTSVASLEDILTRKDRIVKIPLAEDIFETFVKQHPTLPDYAAKVEGVTVSLFATRRLKGHQMYAVNLELRRYLEELDKQREYNGDVNEDMAQDLFRPLFTAVVQIFQFSFASCMRLSEKRRPGEKKTLAPCKAANFIKPEKEPDFAVVHPCRSTSNAIVVACVELKALPAQDQEALNDIVEKCCGPQWVDFLFYGVPFFFAYTGDYFSLEIHQISPEKRDEASRMKIVTAGKFELQLAGISLVHFCLRSMAFNLKAFTNQLSGNFSPYRLKTTKKKGGKRNYWVGGLARRRRGDGDSVVIRLDDKFPPWVEKCVPNNRDLIELYNITKGCTNIVQRLPKRQNVPPVVAPTRDEVVLWLSPVGVNPSVVVENIDHIQWMARDILSALQYLHRYHWCHCDARLNNVVRKLDSSFVLVDMECAQRISTDADEWIGTAELPHGMIASLIREAAMLPRGKEGVKPEPLPSRWRPFYDLSQFVGGALRSAVKVVQLRKKMLSEGRPNVNDDAPDEIDELLTKMETFFRDIVSRIKREDDICRGAPLTAEVLRFTDDPAQLFTFDLPNASQASSKIVDQNKRKRDENGISKSKAAKRRRGS